MYRVGIIGCGNIANVHAEVLSSLENIRLCGCADILPERAERLAGRFGGNPYADWKQMAQTEKLDAVHLCTPHFLHPTMAAEAADLGLAVFTEKPPALNAEGWRLIHQAAEKVPLGICFQNRYLPHIQACHRLLGEGTYGALKGIRAFVTWNRSAAYYQEAAWKGHWDTEGGGALINQAIHTLDLVLGFLGQPQQVEVSMRDHHLRGVIEVEDTVEIYLRRAEVPALLYASTAYSADVPVLIELQLEKAALRLEDDRLTLIQGSRREELIQTTDAALGRSYWGAGHKACITDFYRAMATGEPYANDVASCENTMQVLFRLYEQGRRSMNEK